MASFESYYRELFDTFGYPLGVRCQTPQSVLDTAEKRLDIRLPAALRDYYLVAGRERRFNDCQNRFLPPTDWFVDQRRVVFMKENQAVCFWGTRFRDETAEDPPVFQGINDDPISWYREHAKCSVFIAVMLHYQAVCGAFPNSGSATLTEDSKKGLRKGWRYVGQINKQRAYSRQNQVVFLTSSPIYDAQILMAGAKTKGDLQAIECDLGVQLN